MSEIVFDATSETDTQRLGMALAESVTGGTVVALCGTLGAGKTRLVQAVAAACGIDRQQVTSPTFVLCQTYRGKRTIHHFDVYRLKDEQEFLELGPDEYFESDALSLVEWAEKVEELLPPGCLQIEIEVTGPTQRRFTLRTDDRGLQTVLEQITARLAAARHEPPVP
ncbi:MAG TPA: tRNA (adenosine(37)-N6)-threonylcarbamoyltransferase complex ATPase subunit type 1 TsaE [Pirellulaceae bacterium]|nr:tRNA (adenosine(37)-N6)-threonylcarbamoyltransferase complex ATPase subunit type 1 TsaE [Pirellulaceae bacterium]